MFALLRSWRGRRAQHAWLVSLACVFTCAGLTLRVPVVRAQAGDASPAPVPSAPEASDDEPSFWEASRAEDLQIKLVTFGPGDDVFNYFGHNALIVEDTADHTARLYNFGMFHFGAAMLPNYLKGKLTFWVGEAPVRATFAHYRAANRSIRIQELNLAPDRKKRMANTLAITVLPQHRDYLYDHFFNNCSTRLRDLIDEATDGQFKRALGHSARMSYRQHIRRYAQLDPITDFALVFWMNGFMERPIKQWDELFLPEELEHQVARMHYRNADGRDTPLVANSYTVYEADRPATPAWPNRGYPMAFLIGCAIGLCALALALWASATGSAWALRWLGVHHALVGLCLGLPGLLAALMWAFTEHTVTYHNQNLLLSNPLTAALFPLGIGMIFGSSRAQRWARFISYALALSTLGLLLLKLAPNTYQDTSLPLGLFLPINVLLAASHRKLAQRSAVPDVQVKPAKEAVSQA